MVRSSFMTLLLLVGTVSAADDKAQEPQEITGARGTLQLQVPGDWQPQRASRIIEHEFRAPAAEGDENAGRMTMSSAGGSVKANIERWKGQFTETESSRTTEKRVDGMTVHLVDLSGTYADRRGPFAPAVSRPNYRMLGAIIETKEAGLYFLKFYGPQKTMDAHAKSFEKIVDGIKAR